MSTQISSIFGPTGKTKPFVTVLVSAPLVVRVPREFAPQHHEAKLSLTYKEKFPILRSQKNDFLSNYRSRKNG